MLSTDTCAQKLAKKKFWVNFIKIKKMVATFV